MQFLANENFPLPCIKHLRKRGYKVISIYEELGGIDDKTVLKKAIEENLIILTFDRDYGKLLFFYKMLAPPAVVYFRFKGDSPIDAAKMLLNQIENHNLKLHGYFTVIESKDIRQRNLG